MAIPAPDQPAASALPHQVTITIGDGRQEVSAGQLVRYEVMVHNFGPVEAPLTVKLTVPPKDLTKLEASEAAVVANAVAWKNVVGAGETRTYSLAGWVDRSPRSRTLAVTACVHDRLNAPAVACATDRNELFQNGTDDSGARRIAWIGSIFFGILAVVGAVWLYRKVNPEPLTPMSPATPASANKPVQPGGAPSD